MSFQGNSAPGAMDNFDSVALMSLPDEIEEFFTKEEFAEMSEYEKDRYKNIRVNYEMMIAVGLPANPPDFMLGPKKKAKPPPPSPPKRSKFQPPRKRKGDHSDSDEDWTPWTETTQRSSNRAQKKVNPFVSPSERPSGKKENRRSASNVNKKLKTKKEQTVASSSATSGPTSSNEAPRPAHSYPLRQLPRKNYMDLEAPDDDDFLYCEDCNKEYEGDCPVHGAYNIILDTPASADTTHADKDRPYNSLPEGLSVKDSMIPKAGLGVWTSQKIPSRSRFGPYEGDITKDGDEAHATGYSWQIYHLGKPKHFVNAYRMETSNWMRYVNCARSESEQNLVAYQYQGQIYYRTYKDIQPNTELLVWYGPEYGKELGIIRNKMEVLPKVVNGQVIYRCPWCPVGLGTLEYLTKHCKYKHGQSVGEDPNRRYEGDDIYRCTQCDVCFSYVDYLIKHAKKNHNTVMTAADLPNKTLHYSSQYQASRGLFNSQPGNKAEVDQANKENIGTRHQTVEPKQATNGKKICKLDVSTESRKNGTVKIDDKSLECTDEKFICANVNSGSKVAHEGKHTGDKRHSCGVCAYSTNDLGNFQRHQLIHTGDKPYKCEQCGFSTTRMGNLQRHKKTHSIGDKAYKCDECGFSTNYKHHLQQHQMTHTGEKPYKCDVCDYSTIHISHLKKHKRIHTDDKPYKCDVCGYSASQMGDLKLHQMSHTGEKPFRCDVCGYCAKRMSDLKKHQKRHTDDKQQ